MEGILSWVFTALLCVNLVVQILIYRQVKNRD